MDEYGQCLTIICNLQDEEHSFAMYMYQPLPTEDLSEVGKQTRLRLALLLLNLAIQQSTHPYGVATIVQGAIVQGTVVQGTFVQGDFCPRRLLSKEDYCPRKTIVQGDICPRRQLVKETIVLGDFCPRRLLSKETIVQVLMSVHALYTGARKPMESESI